MLRYQLDDQPHLTEQIRPMIRLFETDPSSAERFLKAMAGRNAHRPEWKGGYFNQLALSSLPFVAVALTQAQLPSLLRRTRIYGDAIGSVNVEVTPEDEFYAKASAGLCLISLGLVNTVYCVCSYLCALRREMGLSDWFLASAIPKARAGVQSFFALEIRRECGDEFVGNNFRGKSYRPFVENNEVLDKLGVDVEAVDACLTTGDPADVLFGAILASLCVRFIVLHELAHHHYGHSQLLEMWRDHPDVSKHVMKSGFPSPEARRAMESYADVWATEMLITTEIFSDSAVLSNELVGARIPQVTRAKCAIGAVEVAFAILAAVDTVSSGMNALWEDFRSALQGRVDTFYPGAHSRAAFAVRHGALRAASNHPYLRWTRWRAMRTELAAIDSRPIWLALFQLWPACGLGGSVMPIKRAGYEYSPPVRGEETIGRGEHETWHAWDRFDFVKAHHDLFDDLSSAKRWATNKR